MIMRLIMFFSVVMSGWSLLVGCSKPETAEAVEQPDPYIATINTNEVVGIDFREKLKENREKQADAAKVDKLVASIQSFQEEMGRVPSNLTELVEMQYIDKIPTAPRNRKYVYKAEHGQVFEVASDGRAKVEEEKDDTRSSTFIGQ